MYIKILKVNTLKFLQTISYFSSKSEIKWNPELSEVVAAKDKN